MVSSVRFLLMLFSPCSVHLLQPLTCESFCWWTSLKFNTSCSTRCRFHVLISGWPQVYSADWSPRSDVLASACGDDRIRVFQAEEWCKVSGGWWEYASVDFHHGCIGKGELRIVNGFWWDADCWHCWCSPLVQKIELVLRIWLQDESLLNWECVANVRHLSRGLEIHLRRHSDSIDSAIDTTNWTIEQKLHDGSLMNNMDYSAIHENLC